MLSETEKEDPARPSWLHEGKLCFLASERRAAASVGKAKRGATEVAGCQGGFLDYVDPSSQWLYA